MSQADSDFDQAGFDEAGFDDGMDQPAADAYGDDQTQLPEAPKYRKQSFSIYSMMLILSFLFLVASIVLLFMEVGRLTS